MVHELGYMGEVSLQIIHIIIKLLCIHANCLYFGGTVQPFQIYQQQCPAKTPKKGEKSSFFYAIRSYKCIMSS